MLHNESIWKDYVSFCIVGAVPKAEWNDLYVKYVKYFLTYDANIVSLIANPFLLSFLEVGWTN